MVRYAVERGWAGLECLSGIPGLVGATPIQNVGAYGQEVSDTITAVRALDRATREIVTLPPAACGFGYRDSVFKSGAPDRYVVLAVTYRLRPGGPPAVRYAELEQHLAARGDRAPDARGRPRERARRAPREVDGARPRRSEPAELRLVLREPDGPGGGGGGASRRAPGIPPCRAGRSRDGRVKLAAAWLIERAGFARGYADGPAGISTRHTLAIVAHDGARAADVVRVARRVRDGVLDRFGVRLHPEPSSGDSRAWSTASPRP